MLTFATLCSGIDGFGVGMERAGMEMVFQCEQDRHCLSVLGRHYPNVERTTDVSSEETEHALCRLKPDWVAFGSPCQDLSVAGRRGGLAAERSGLFFQCVELCFACQAGGILWENVPGVFSSNGGEDFASVLEAFTGVRPEVPSRGWRNTGVCIGPLYSVAWAVLDSQWFGVPQRRRRVFVVGCFGDRARPYEILSLGESLPWDSPPSREAGARTAGTLTAGVASGRGVNRPGRRREDDVNIVAHPLTARHDSSEDGCGRGTPIIAATRDVKSYRTSGNCGAWDQGDKVACLDNMTDPNQNVLTFAYGGGNCSGEIDVATCLTHHGNRQDFDSETFISQSYYTHEYRHQSINSIDDPADALAPSETRMRQGYHMPSGVRRLTPRECERLQGFPDDWTRYDEHGNEISDSARYRMCGNAVTVNVAQWIGQRIVEAAQ